MVGSLAGSFCFKTSSSSCNFDLALKMAMMIDKRIRFLEIDLCFLYMGKTYDS